MIRLIIGLLGVLIFFIISIILWPVLSFIGIFNKN